MIIFIILLGKCEDANEVIRSRKSKDTQYIWQNKEDKRSIKMIYEN